MKCILCRRNDANSSEHNWKKSLIKHTVAELGCTTKEIPFINIKNGKTSSDIAQGPRSKKYTFEETICSNCNSKVSADADKAIDTHAKDLSLGRTPIGELFDSLGLQCTPVGDLISFVNNENSIAFKYILHADIIGIYEYIYNKVDINRLMENKNEFSIQLLSVFQRLNENGLQLLRTPRSGFVGKLNKEECEMAKPLLAKYFSKIMACSLYEANIPIPKSLRNTFFNGEIDPDININIHRLSPWVKEMLITSCFDVYIDTEGRLISYLYQELTPESSYLVFFEYKKVKRRVKTVIIKRIKEKPVYGFLSRLVK